MAGYLKSTVEFASLANQLQSRPHDSALKHALIQRLPEMKALAKTDPWALYCLAQMYPQRSVQYEQMIRRSADAGCTNAMLAVCYLLMQLDTPASLQEAEQYMQAIEQSQDSYIRACAQQLAANHFVSRSEKHVVPESVYDNVNRFFMEQPVEQSSTQKQTTLSLSLK